MALQRGLLGEAAQTQAPILPNSRQDHTQKHELLDSLAKPLPPKRTIIAKLPTWQVTVLLLDYTSYQEKDIAVLILKVKTDLE